MKEKRKTSRQGRSKPGEGQIKVAKEDEGNKMSNNSGNLFYMFRLYL